METEDLPPTQYLIMEILAARARLGETYWTFPSRMKAAVGALAIRGLVVEMSGVVEKTIRARLTDAGRDAAMWDGYTGQQAVTEHATMMSSGAMMVRNAAPEIERIYPLADLIIHEQRWAGKVWQRRVIVVEDWKEVPGA